MANSNESLLAGAKVLPFILGGKSTFTLRSVKTGTRYTYRVSAAKEKPGLFFAKVLAGTDSYVYIGVISKGVFRLTAASKMAEAAVPVVAFKWMLERVTAGAPTPNMEFWHAGKCGRCGRKLTVPESIACGLGPECAGKVASCSFAAIRRITSIKSRNELLK